jgi:hypothetical protein
VANSITETQIAEVTRILGFPNLSPNSGADIGYPYYSSQLMTFQPYIILVVRLTQASPADEVQYFGAESPLFGSFFAPGTVAFTFSTPTTIAVGVSVQMNIGDNTVSYETIEGDTPATVVAALYALIRENDGIRESFMVNPSGAVLTIINTKHLGVNGNGVQCIALSSDPSLLAAAGTGSASQMAFGTTAGGTNPPGPRFVPVGGSPVQDSEPIYGYVPIIRVLESDLINSRENLDTQKADSWVPSPYELGKRSALLNSWRRRLADSLSVPLDPDIAGNARRMGGGRRVV